jgi:hypothetical protein
MTRTCGYHGFTLGVEVESEFSFRPNKGSATPPGYVAIVRIFQAENAVAIFLPQRFGEAGGRRFASNADALMGGYSAARRIVDDLFSQTMAGMRFCPLPALHTRPAGRPEPPP